MIFDDEDNHDENIITQHQSSSSINKQYEYIQFINDLNLNDLSTIIEEIIDIDQRNDTQIEIAIHLILRLVRRGSTSCSLSNLSDILRFITSIEPHPKITRYYLQLLQLFDNEDDDDEKRKLIIEKIPEICGSTSSEVQLIMDQLSQCITEDRSICTIAIGTLYELSNLTMDQRVQITNITLNSLDYVDEEDLPVLIRTLLKTVTKENAEYVVESIRNTGDIISAHISTIICTEVLVNIFSVNTIAVKYFISAIKKLKKPLSRFDLLIILTLLHTHQRERKTIFNLLKNAYQTTPVPMIHLNTVLETISEDYLALSQSKIFSNSVLSLATYMLHHKNIFIEDDNIPWAHPICLLVFQLYKDNQSQLVSDLLVSLQPNNSSIVSEIDYHSTSCVSGDILISISCMESWDSQATSSCQILSEYSSVLEDGLIRSKKLSARSIHSLCYALCRCIEFKSKIVSNLMMFIRKQLFSAQDQQTQIGIIAASHLLNYIGNNNNSEQYTEESNTLIEWILNTLYTHGIDSKTIHFLDLIYLNYNHLENTSLEYIYENCIQGLIHHLELITDKPVTKHQLYFKYGTVEKHYFQLTNLYNQQKDVTFIMLQTVYQLVRCLIRLQIRLKNSGLIQFLSYGYNIDIYSVYSTLFAYTISVCISQCVTDNDNEIIQEELLHHQLYSIMCLKVRLQEMYGYKNVTEQKKALIRQTLANYQVDTQLISKYISSSSSSSSWSQMTLPVHTRVSGQLSIHVQTLHRELLQTLWTRIHSYKIINNNGDKNSSLVDLVTDKQKGVARENIIQVVEDCYRVQRKLNFGALYREMNRCEGKLEELFDQIMDCLKILFKETDTLVEQLRATRITKVASITSDSDEDDDTEMVETNSKDDEEKQDEQQRNIFLTLRYVFQVL
jgi:hypothetical protein